MDFFPFGPEVYFRLFVRQNEAIWPAHILAILLGIAVIALAWRGRGRWVGLILGASWAFVGYTFHLELYANLNWAAEHFGWAFIAQGALLAGAGVLGRLDCAPDSDADSDRKQDLDGAGWLGLGLAVFALAIFPLLGPLLGREWTGVEVFGVAPDPTVIATLGLLLTARRPQWLLLVVPLLWCVVSGASALAMDASASFATPAAGLIALAATLWRTLRDVLR
ncbi:MAG: DUF6064 family protein [Persicimonas sp.]